MENKIYKWIEIQKILESESGKTDIFEIRTKDDKIIIAQIKWSPRWRKYSFQPFPNTEYEEECMDSISDFLRMLKEERKKKCNLK